MNKLRPCTDREEWDDFLLDNAGHPLQLWGWGEVKSVHGWSADRLLMVTDDDKPVAAAQVLYKKLPWPFKSLAYVPRGPVVGEGQVAEFLQLLSDYIKTNHPSVAVSIEPDAVNFAVPSGWEKTKNRILPASTVVLDLEKTEEELMAAMASKTRQYIRKSAADINIRSVRGHDQLQSCLDIYKDTAIRAKFDVHDDGYYIDIFDKLGENSPVLAAYVADQPVAFLWLAISADTAFELYGGMNEQGKELRANYALKWTMIKKCKNWGLTRYDFGGLIEGGVSNFKMNWTDAPTELAGTFQKSLSIWAGLYNFVAPIAKKLSQKLRH